MILPVILALIFSFVWILLNIRLVDQDEEYGSIGLGQVAESAANTYSVASIDDIVEPTLIYDIDFSGNKVTTRIEEILVWDNRWWEFHMLNEIPVAGLEDDVTSVRAGIARDNSLDKSEFPTAEQFLAGEGNSVVGASSGTLNVMNADTFPEVEAEVRFVDFADEEQTAVGQILIQYEPFQRYAYSPYQESGITRHHLMTMANYYCWLVSFGLASAQTVGLSMEARLMSIDIEELFADRQVILNLADALTILTI